MNESEKVERLFMTPAEELVKLHQAEWDGICSGIHGGDLRLIANSLIQLAVKAARMGAYVEARANGKQHEAAVSEQNALAEKVRSALGFHHPKADIDF